MRPSPSFRPDLETLSGRVLPALLSLPLPVSAVVAARVAPADCAPALVAVDARVAVNLNASLGVACAPDTCAPSPCAPGQLAGAVGGLLNRVGSQVDSTVGSIGSAIGGAVRHVGTGLNYTVGSVGWVVGGVVRQVGTDLNYTVGAVDSIVTGQTAGCRPSAPPRC